MDVFLDVMNGTSKVIVATEGDNNTKKIRIILTENDYRINLNNKTLRMAIKSANSKEGKIINDLTITSAEKGEIELIITKELTENNGLFYCQIEVSGDEYVRYTEKFNIYIKENLFKDLFI